MDEYEAGLVLHRVHLYSKQNHVGQEGFFFHASTNRPVLTPVKTEARFKECAAYPCKSSSEVAGVWIGAYMEIRWKTVQLDIFIKTERTGAQKETWASGGKWLCSRKESRCSGCGWRGGFGDE